MNVLNVLNMNVSNISEACYIMQVIVKKRELMNLQLTLSNRNWKSPGCIVGSYKKEGTSSSKKIMSCLPQQSRQLLRITRSGQRKATFLPYARTAAPSWLPMNTNLHFWYKVYFIGTANFWHFCLRFSEGEADLDSHNIALLMRNVSNSL